MKVMLVSTFSDSGFLVVNFCLLHGFLCSKVAATTAVEQIFQDWDIKQTDKLLEKLEGERNARQEEERKLREVESNRSAV